MNKQNRKSSKKPPKTAFKRNSKYNYVKPVKKIKCANCVHCGGCGGKLF